MADHDHLITVDLLPIPCDKPDPGILSSDASSAVPGYFTLANAAQNAAEPLPYDAMNEARERWISAYTKCLRHTLRSLSFPLDTRYSELSDDLGLEGHSRHSVVSILASGLPLPKSPSYHHLTNGNRGQSALDLVDGEREERGWWTLRFKQILREMERVDDPVLLMSTPRPGSTPRPRRGVPAERLKRVGPQPLLLSGSASPSILTSTPNPARRSLFSVKRR